MWGDQNFLGWSKGGTSFFSVGQRGRPEFFQGQRGVDQNFFSNFFLRLQRNFFLNTLYKNFSRLRCNLSLYHTTCHIICSYIIIFSQLQDIHSFCPLHCLCEGNVHDVLSPWGGGPEFFHEAKGGTKIFPRRQRGDQNFFTYANGGTEKNWQPAITDTRPRSR